MLPYAHMHAHDWEQLLWRQQDDVLSPQNRRHDFEAVQASARWNAELIHCLRKLAIARNVIEADQREMFEERMDLHD